MNERIKNIAVQCGAWNQVYNNKEFMVDRTFNVEKFAQLLLKDVLETCNLVGDWSNQLNLPIRGEAAKEIAGRIKHNYGIIDV
jgi:hypothetical protein